MLSTFKKFLTKYAGELSVIADVGKFIVNVLPIHRDEKAAIEAKLKQLDDAIESITASVPDLKVQISKSDIEAVVAELLPAAIAKAQAGAAKTTAKAPAKTTAKAPAKKAAK